MNDELPKLNNRKEGNFDDEQEKNANTSVKCRRTKERKIGYIIEKVNKWRKLYNGNTTDETGNKVKLSLEESAKEVGISKKSLDDYLLQIR